MLLAMSLFALSMSISPGPVNLVSFTAASNYGFYRAFIFVSGATIGFTLLLICIGLGASQLHHLLPMVIRYISYAGTAFIAWMGFKIVTSALQLGSDDDQAPQFFHGFLLQWLNPKAWIACLAGVSAFGLTASYARLLAFVSLYFVICYLSMTLWAWAGKQMQRLIDRPAAIGWLNRTMGTLLLLIAGYLGWSAV